MAGRPGGGGRATTRAAGAARACALSAAPGQVGAAEAGPKDNGETRALPEMPECVTEIDGETRALLRLDVGNTKSTERSRRDPTVAGETRAFPKQGRGRTKRAERRKRLPRSAGRARVRTEPSRKVPKRNGAARVARARPRAEAPRRWRVRAGSRDSPATRPPRSPGPPGSRHPRGGHHCTGTGTGPRGHRPHCHTHSPAVTSPCSRPSGCPRASRGCSPGSRRARPWDPHPRHAPGTARWRRSLQHGSSSHGDAAG